MTQLTTKKDNLPSAIAEKSLQNNLNPFFFENLIDDLIQNTQDAANLADFYTLSSPLPQAVSIIDEPLILKINDAVDTSVLNTNPDTLHFSSGFKATYCTKQVPEKDIFHKLPASTPGEEPSGAAIGDKGLPEASKAIIFLPVSDTIPAVENDLSAYTPDSDSNYIPVQYIGLPSQLAQIS
ncbi:hypothetical protein [Crenothrix sp.]|uniref:hypothetical protein n=1 Tax=Crenothrix sp. TaxID=3100433 RepID=UPI00374DE78C